MRQRSKNGGISVHAIAGTEVVLLGLDATDEVAEGLLGFSIFKSGGRTRKPQPLGGGRDFEGIQSPTPVLQTFQWSDYVVDPNTTYTYRVVPVYGTPAKPKPGEPVEVRIKTENPEDQTHAVYFNRGVAGSQAYSRRFGDHRRWYKTEHQGRVSWQEYVKPGDVPERQAYQWLSRGLEEAMLRFIGQARGPEYALRAAVYELTYLPVVQAFVDALESGADVKILHHAKRAGRWVLKKNPDTEVVVTTKDGSRAPVTHKNQELRRELSYDPVAAAARGTVAAIGLRDPAFQDAFDQMLIERTDTTISHNKFIVLLKNGEPVQVWTGSTNLTTGGIYGQNNVGHVVRDKDVAKKYYEYWHKLATDPKKRSPRSGPPDAGIRDWNQLHQPDLQGPPPPGSITPVFSPRPSKAMLEWYADRLDAAESSVFFTAAFSVANEIFDKVIKTKKVGGRAYLRYLLLEGIGGLLKPKYPVMAKCPQNRIAWGETLRRRAGGEEEHKQFIETLTGINSHVQYLHTKYMLIDPLSDDPIVITGSANFSEASTVNNDENMLIIRGDTRVADIFLGEFMRLFNHFRARNGLNRLSDAEAKIAEFLKPDDSWTKPYYTAGTQACSERMLFS
jgi:phosphatidylserine/phosphatidylglycerophosphate/cardiolipin synthase-like enzyme